MAKLMALLTALIADTLCVDSASSYIYIMNNSIHDARFGGYMHGNIVEITENTFDYLRNIGLLMNEATNVLVENNTFGGYFFIDRKIMEILFMSMAQIRAFTAGMLCS